MAGIDEYTKLLLHCTGADQSTSFPDSSGNNRTVTAYGAMQVDTGVADPWGGNAGVMQATADGDYALAANNPDYCDFGTGDFCVDFQFRKNGAASGIDGLIGCLYTPGNLGWEIAVKASTRKLMMWSANAEILTSDTDYTDNTWTHVAVARLGANLYLFQGGVLVDTAVAGTINGHTGGSFCIGRFYYNNAAYYGQMQLAEIRVSKGTGRIDQLGDSLYISSGDPADGFTPPDGPYSPYIFSRQSDRANVRAAVASQQADRAVILRDTITSQQADRIDVRALVASQQADRADIRGGITSQQADRADIFAYINSRQSDRANIFAYIQSRQADRAHIMLLDGWDIYEDGTLLGKIDEAGYLDVALAAGTHDIEIRPRRWFWGCRMAQKLTVTVSAGGAVTSILPAVVDLALSYESDGSTKISFRCPAALGVENITSFRVWYGAASPVSTVGAAADTITLSGLNPIGTRAFWREQTGAEYASIRSTDGTYYSQAAEILLPALDAALLSPERQFARES